jgi:pyruvate/2-oxoglutarate dehydrogenase complex dihydrolipoamide acyltransferase (E2) component
MGFLPLSFDHRALDGATAARFLARVKELLEGGDVR